MVIFLSKVPIRLKTKVMMNNNMNTEEDLIENEVNITDNNDDVNETNV